KVGYMTDVSTNPLGPNLRITYNDPCSASGSAHLYYPQPENAAAFGPVRSASPADAGVASDGGTSADAGVSPDAGPTAELDFPAWPMPPDEPGSSSYEIGEDAVHDLTTALTWQRFVDEPFFGPASTWQDAHDYCPTLALGG